VHLFGEQVKDYTGQKFGHFTVVKYLGKNNGHIKWLCRCDCGTEKSVRISHLIDGNTVSCGCHRRVVGKRMAAENGISKQSPLRSGERFGRWIVIQKDQLAGNPIRYICRCDCGTIRSVNRCGLVTGQSKSCGCYHKEISAQQARRLFTKHGKSKDRDYICFLKRRRYHADRDWTLEMNQLLFELQPTCVICKSTDRLEIDHVTPSTKGGKLEPGNVVVLCRSCNQAKCNKDLSALPTEWQEKIKHACQDFAQAWVGTTR